MLATPNDELVALPFDRFESPNRRGLLAVDYASDHAAFNADLMTLNAIVALGTMCSNHHRNGAVRLHAHLKFRRDRLGFGS